MTDLASAERLKGAIIQSLCQQGYCVKDGVIQLPEDPSKDHFRNLKQLALQKNWKDPVRGSAP